MTKKKRSSSAKPARRKAKARGNRASADMIISKTRTKAASQINVANEFYGALDSAVRALIASAERRALDNGRKTLRSYDL